MYCPYCGEGVTEGAVSCTNCRKAIPYSTVTKPYAYSDAQTTPAVDIDEDNTAWGFFMRSINILFKKPILFVPLFCSWIIYASAVILAHFYLTSSGSYILDLIRVFVLLVFITLTICTANLMMLEFLQQIESGARISWTRTLKETLGIDFIRMIPIALIWSFLWLVIIVLRALTSKAKKDKEKNKPTISAHEVAKTLANTGGDPLSWFGLGLDLAEKLIRMVVFLILPAIAWDNAGPNTAFDKALDIIKKHPVQFMTNYTLSLAATGVMAIPLAIVFTLDEIGMEFSQVFWVIVIIYEGLVWSLVVYLEQMSGALLYLWHLKWLRKGANGELSSVPKPSILDTKPEV